MHLGHTIFSEQFEWSCSYLHAGESIENSGVAVLAGGLGTRRAPAADWSREEIPRKWPRQELPLIGKPLQEKTDVLTGARQEP